MDNNAKETSLTPGENNKDLASPVSEYVSSTLKLLEKAKELANEGAFDISKIMFQGIASEHVVNEESNLNHLLSSFGRRSPESVELLQRLINEDDQKIFNFKLGELRDQWEEITGRIRTGQDGIIFIPGESLLIDLPTSMDGVTYNLSATPVPTLRTEKPSRFEFNEKLIVRRTKW